MLKKYYFSVLKIMHGKRQHAWCEDPDIGRELSNGRNIHSDFPKWVGWWEQWNRSWHVKTTAVVRTQKHRLLAGSNPTRRASRFSERALGKTVEENMRLSVQIKFLVALRFLHVFLWCETVSRMTFKNQSVLNWEMQICPRGSNKK